MTRLVSLTVGGDLNAWRSIGLSFGGQSARLADVELVVAPGAPSGIHSWTFAVAPSDDRPRGELLVDGIATVVVDEVGNLESPASSIGEQRIVGLDHVVVNTDDLDRTCAAIESALGAEVRRVRALDNGMEQRFHKVDNCIIEVVGGPQVRTPGASLWGMVASVDDLFELAEALGPDVVSTPKRATQPGRYIATVRASVGLGVPFALMTPHVPGTPAG